MRLIEKKLIWLFHLLLVLLLFSLLSDNSTTSSCSLETLLLSPLLIVGNRITTATYGDMYSTIAGDRVLNDAKFKTTLIDV